MYIEFFYAPNSIFTHENDIL